MDYDPPSTQIKTTGQKSYRDYQKDLTLERSEMSNLNQALGPKPLELTEENMKLYEENLKELERDDDYEFYSNFDDQKSNEDKPTDPVTKKK